MMCISAAGAATDFLSTTSVRSTKLVEGKGSKVYVVTTIDVDVPPETYLFATFQSAATTTLPVNQRVTSGLCYSTKKLNATFYKRKDCPMLSAWTAENIYTPGNHVRSIDKVGVLEPSSAPRKIYVNGVVSLSPTSHPGDVITIGKSNTMSTVHVVPRSAVAAFANNSRDDAPRNISVSTKSREWYPSRATRSMNLPAGATPVEVVWEAEVSSKNMEDVEVDTQAPAASLPAVLETNTHDMHHLSIFRSRSFLATDTTFQFKTELSPRASSGGKLTIESHHFLGAWAWAPASGAAVASSSKPAVGAALTTSFEPVFCVPFELPNATDAVVTSNAVVGVECKGTAPSSCGSVSRRVVVRLGGCNGTSDSATLTRTVSTDAQSHAVITHRGAALVKAHGAAGAFAAILEAKKSGAGDAVVSEGAFLSVTVHPQK